MQLQRWKCDACGATGKVTLPTRAGVWEGFQALVRSHREGSPDCARADLVRALRFGENGENVYKPRECEG